MIKAPIRISISKGLVFCIVFGMILFGCQKINQQKNPDEMEKFLRHAMISCTGVYTLVGVKPVTEFNLLTSEPSQERLLKIYNSLSQRVREKHSFEEVSQHFREEYELWSAWSNVKSEYMGNNFRFFVDPFVKDRVVFANLTAVALVLDEHYEDFKKAYGQDFEPIEMIYSIDSGDSEFWRVCFSNHYLSGLLYGFGRSNAKLFNWERQNKIPGEARTGSNKRPPKVNNPTITELPLPSFVIYSPLDEKVLFYKQMREKIMELYKEKDFKEQTLKLLSDKKNSLGEI